MKISEGKALDKLDVLAVGELLIDFTPIKAESQQKCYEQNAGGAPANLLAMVSKLGGKAAFAGKVGNDQFGKYLANVLKQLNIDTQGLVYTDDAVTTLAFVHLDVNGERSFTFCRKPGADLLLKTEEIDRALIDRSTIFHFGSLSLTDEPSKNCSY